MGEARRGPVASPALSTAVAAVAAALLAALLLPWGAVPPGMTPAHSELCSVDRVEELSCEDFVRLYQGKRPVILRAAGAVANPDFVHETRLETMRERHGELPLKLSTANAFTGREWRQMSMLDYLDDMLAPQRVDKQGNQTLYLFGSQYGTEWDRFLENYVSPASVYPGESFGNGLRLCASGYALTAEMVALSFGIAGHGTGVPFHFHGATYLHMLHGRKRCFLYPPQSKPRYHPNETTLHWVTHVYPSMASAERPTHECVLDPGDVIYFPSDWLHATLNLADYTAFIASFA